MEHIRQVLCPRCFEPAEKLHLVDGWLVACEACVTTGQTDSDYLKDPDKWFLKGRQKGAY